MIRSRSAILTLSVLAGVFAGPAQTDQHTGVEDPSETSVSGAGGADGGAGGAPSEEGTAPARPPEPAIVYRPPRRGAPAETVGGGVRGAIKLPTPLALAPDHVAHTSRARPDLFWHIDAAPPEGTRVFFALVDRCSLETTSEVELERPRAAGIYRVRLAEHQLELSPGVEYEWSIALVEDIESRSRDVVSTRYIRRVDEPRLADRAPDARTYAELGLWYDALETLSDAIDAAPHEEVLRGQRNSLLDQANLGMAVE